MRRTRPPKDAGTPFRLVPGFVSSDTIEALELLLGAARKGDVVGLAFAAQLRRGRFMVDAAGECCRHPTLARGFVRSLDDELRAMVESAAEVHEPT